MAIVASDVVAVPYRAVDRPSGIVCRSMAWNRPMLMTNRGWLKWILDEFDSGFGAITTDPVKLGESIKSALDQSTSFQITEKASKFVNFNTEQNYLDTWRSGVESSRGETFQSPNFLNPHLSAT